MRQTIGVIVVIILGFWGSHPVVLPLQDNRPCVVMPTSINFGEVQVGNSKDETLTVTNNGSDPFTLNAINSDHPAFTIESTNPLLPATLMMGDSVTVTVRFDCQQAGSQSGRLSFETDPAGGICESVRVTGLCTTDPPSPCGIAPSNVLFGQVDVGSERLETVTITNNSTDPFTLLAITSSNESFLVLDTDPLLPATLAQGESLTAFVLFVCLGEGDQSGTLTLETNPQMTCRSVRMAGTCGEETRPTRPSDGGGPLPRSTTTEIIDDAGSGAALISPAFSLNSDTVVTIDRLSDLAKAPFPDVPGFRRVSEVIKFDAIEGARAFGPGLVLRFPLLPESQDQFPIGKNLRLFELGRTNDLPSFLDTGIIAEVAGAGRRRFVHAPHVEVFGTYAVFEELDVPTAADRQLQPPLEGPCPGGSTLLFPMVEQLPGVRFTRLSLINPSEQPADITFRAYDRTGRLVPAKINPIVLGSLQQQTLLIDALFDLSPGEFLWSVVGCSSNPSVTGMVEVTNTPSPTLENATMLAAAPVQFNAETALIFPLLRRLDTGFRRIHLFNPSAEPVSVEMCLYNLDGRLQSSTNSAISLPAFGRLVIDENANPEMLNGMNLRGLPDEEDGYLSARVVEGAGFVGAELFGSVNGDGTVKTLAALNGLPVPPGFVFAPGGGNLRCQVVREVGGTLYSAAASLTRTLYAAHLEASSNSVTIKTDLFVINLTDGPNQIDISSFSPRGEEQGRRIRFRRLQPRRGFRQTLQDLPDLIPSPGGYIRLDVAESGAVGMVINRDMDGNFITAVPLGSIGKHVKGAPTPMGAAAEVFLSRVKQDRSNANPNDAVAFLLLYPNHASGRVPVTLDLSSPTGGNFNRQRGQVDSQGTFLPTRESLSGAYRNLSQTGGFLRAVTDPPVGFGRGVIAVGVYRRQQNGQIRFLSAVEAQVRPNQ